MKIYRTERMVTEFDIDADDFLAFLQRNDSDEEVQKAKTLDELLEVYTLDDFAEEVSLYTGGGDVISYHNSFYDNIEEADSDMEFGIH